MAARKRDFDTHKGPVGWAVVGLGMGGVHARFVAKSPGLKLVALCDTNRERLERAGRNHKGVALHDSIKSLLADERVEGVSLVLPHDQHAPQTMKCLAAGRHVVLDKPFCLKVVDGKRMIASAKRKRRLLSVFHNRRWDADYVTIQKIVDSGRIGRVRYLESRVAGPGYWNGGFWRCERRHMGGLLYDWGAHLIDQAMFLIKSRPVSVYGIRQRDRRETKGCDVEDRMQAVINFECGAVALVAWMLGSPAPVPRFIVEGEKGGIRSEQAVHSQQKPKAGEGLDLYTVVGRRKRKTKRVPFARVDWSAFYRNIGAALLGKAPLAVRPEEALRHVAVNEAAYRSAKTGRAERLG
ncbi:MAG: Gfo/Idh/MocA family protein [Planctomycetota bacterium]|jgi:predicted dehydrogenase